MTLEQAKTKIENEKLTRADVNALQGTMPFADWNQLRIAVNDKAHEAMRRDIDILVETVNELIGIAEELVQQIAETNANRAGKIMLQLSKIKHEHGIE